MIAGELEYIHGQGTGEDQYDYFFKKLFGKKNKRPKKTEEEKAASKEKRSAFWGKVGSGYQKAGGAEGILGTVSNVMNFFKPGEQPEDYEVGMGHPEEEEQKKGIPKEVIIIGGIAVIAVAAWGFSQYKRNQAIKGVATAAQ